VQIAASVPAGISGSGGGIGVIVYVALSNNVLRIFTAKALECWGKYRIFGRIRAQCIIRWINVFLKIILIAVR